MKETSPNLEMTTHFRNGFMARNLIAYCGKILLSKASPAVISGYKAERQALGFSKETIVRELGFLRRIFNIAVSEWELCNSNPVPVVLRTLGKSDNKRIRYLQADELQRLTVSLPSWLRPIVTIARHTGLRRGNLLNLTWEQINSNRGVLIVPKTKNSDPLGLPITKTAAKVFQELQKVRHLHSPYVFCDSSGNRFTDHQVSMAFRRACKRAGIINLRFHDLRHDFASRLVQNGVDIYSVKELLGHKDIRMTLRYAHLAPDSLKSSVKVLDQIEDYYDSMTVGENQKGLRAVTP
jgi:integrase